MLKHQVNSIRQFAKNLIITTGYLSNMVYSAALSLGIDEVVNVGNLGNASWIRSSHIGLIDSPMLILTCDNIMTINLLDLEREVNASSEKSLIVPISKDSTYAGDRIRVAGRRIVSIGPSNNTSLLASGMQVITPLEISSKEGNFYDFSEVWQTLIASESLYLSSTTPSSWMSVDTPTDLEKYELLISSA